MDGFEDFMEVFKNQGGKNPQALPSDVQKQIQDILARQQMARSFQTGAMQNINRPPQSQGRIAAKTSPFSMVANVLQGYLGQRGSENAGREAEEVLTGYQKEQQGAMDAMNALPEDERASHGMGQTRYPQVQAAANAMAAAQQKRILAGAKALETTKNPLAAIDMLSNNKFPKQGGLTLDPRAAPVLGKDASGNAYALTEDADRSQNLTFAPKETKITTTLPGQDKGFDKWAEAAVEDNQALGKSARSAQELSHTLKQLGGLDEAGVISGPAAAPVVWLEGLAKQAGMKIDNATLANSQAFDSLAKEAVQQLVGQYGGNKGVTKEEAAAIAQTLPSLQQSPEARSTLSKILLGVAGRRQAEYESSRQSLHEALTTKDMTKYNLGAVQVPNTPQPALVPPVAPTKPAAPGKPIGSMSKEEKAAEIKRLEELLFTSGGMKP
jgi:hypothetical protein